MAAGIGKRMQPVTLETPKPLVLVNGTRMIETIIHSFLCLTFDFLCEIYNKKIYFCAKRIFQFISFNDII